MTEETGSESSASVNTQLEAEHLIFREELLSAGLLVATGATGLFGRSADFEGVVEGLEGLVGEIAAAEGSSGFRFPPMMPRAVFEETRYLASFPQLIGSISTFKGGEREHALLVAAAESGGAWEAQLEPAGLALCSAVCHPLYPTLAGSGRPEGGVYDVSGWCFRHEPSVDPFRMQAFRQHDLVYVGEPSPTVERRDRWIELGAELLRTLGLGVEVVPANDTFFGRAGRLLARNQREEALKYEIVTPMYRAGEPTAIASGNCHLDHFGGPFHLTTPNGEVAHSACFGFGLDRIALALLRNHGLRPRDWPSSVRAKLWP